MAAELYSSKPHLLVVLVSREEVHVDLRVVFDAVHLVKELTGQTRARYYRHGGVSLPRW